MARLARVVVPGVPHHVTQRGNRRQETFFGEEDYAAYLALLGEWCGRCGVAVWAYCLMPNHVHLIVVPRRRADGLRRGLGEAHRRYTRRINFREGGRDLIGTDPIVRCSYNYLSGRVRPTSRLHCHPAFSESCRGGLGGASSTLPTGSSSRGFADRAVAFTVACVPVSCARSYYHLAPRLLRADEATRAVRTSTIMKNRSCRRPGMGRGR
jgi:REP element-mobilizing transposase RayT